MWNFVFTRATKGLVVKPPQAIKNGKLLCSSTSLYEILKWEVCFSGLQKSVFVVFITTANVCRQKSDRLWEKLEPLTSTLMEHNDILLELLCPLDPLRGTLTTNQCKVVLSDHLFIITKRFYSQWSCFFQNDNAATHRAGRVTELLSEDGIDINNIMWALRPQDLSLITHLWKILD